MKTLFNIVDAQEYLP